MTPYYAEGGVRVYHGDCLVDPVAAVKASGDDGGLFDLLGEETA